MKKIIALSLTLMVLTVLSGIAHSAENTGVYFPERYTDEGVEMTLSGTGLKSVIFMKAFVAALYTTEENAVRTLGQFPKRIEVEYFVSIPAEKMNNFTIKSMKENISDREFAQIKDELREMSQYFVNLEPGDRFSLTFIPGIGTKFVHNGQMKGVIQGELFAKALFSTWLGEKPFDKKLKEQVLGLDKNNESNDKQFMVRLEK